MLHKFAAVSCSCALLRLSVASMAQDMAEMGRQEALAAKKTQKKGGSTLPFDQLCAPPLRLSHACPEGLCTARLSYMLRAESCCAAARAVTGPP